MYGSNTLQMPTETYKHAELQAYRYVWNYDCDALLPKLCPRKTAQAQIYFVNLCDINSAS